MSSKWLALALLFGVKQARSDVGVVIADPTSQGASAYTHAGHALVYFSNVCAASPIRARLCTNGEHGSVVTIYPNFRELKPYAWNIVPLNLYIQGTERAGNRLLYGSESVKAALAEHARTGFLHEVCAGSCPTLPHSYWRDLVASTIERDVFIYAVRTTPKQDQDAVLWLNAQSNVNRYNGITHNCAMFAQSLMNFIFPHSVHRDILNDIGMMSPKAAARSFSRWARKRPELGYYTMHYAQAPGSLKRSGTASSGTEAAIHIKKYLIAAALIGDHEVAGSFFVAYLLTGRFNLYKEYTQHAVPDAGRVDKLASGDSLAIRHASEIDYSINGTEQTWAQFQQQFQDLSRDAGLDWKSLHKQLAREWEQSSAAVDDQGNAWLTAGDRHIGLQRANLLAADSDPTLAFQLIWWRVGYVLHAKPRMRPSLPEFRDDWDLLNQASERARAFASARADAAHRNDSSEPSGASRR